jgi:hypothetical protein
MNSRSAATLRAPAEATARRRSCTSAKRSGSKHPAADHRQQNRRHDADEEHKPPTMGADQTIGPGGDEGADRKTAHHATGDLRPVRLAESLGQQWDAHHHLGAGAEPANETVDREIPDPLGEPLQRGEYGVDGNAEGKGAHPADIVGEDAEQEAAEGPAEQPRHREQAAVFANRRGRRVAAQEVDHRRP